MTVETVGETIARDTAPQNPDAMIILPADA